MENLETETKGFFQSTTAKMIMVGLLTLILLIPLTLIQDLITERSVRQKEVIAETSSKWGESVYFYGPILKIPYKDPITSQVQNAYFFPEKLSNTTNTEMKSPLQRSIYKSNVFTTKMEFSGNYTEPNFAKKSIPTENVFWDKATIVIRTTNLKSINDEVKIKIKLFFMSFLIIH